MCGFAGILATAHLIDSEELESVALRMADRLRHRGPDDRGVWSDPEAGIALGFRRLAIVDLTPEGHQPMVSACGRYVVAFNGEIYNHRSLREELEGGPGTASPAFRGHSDTEVLLAAVSRWGLRRAVERSVGMYALALWDRRERRLHLVRDRVGEKPLFYGWMGPTFLFGSELKALRAHPDFVGEVDRDALAVYIQHGYVPGPLCIEKRISKLTPGTILTIDPSRPGTTPEPEAYWDARSTAEACAADPFRGGDPEAIDRLDGLLREAVGLQMIADVPTGAFLSGGIDSSTIVAIMQAQSARPVETFTIGFREQGYDEASYARAVASHIGTNHTELYVTTDDAMEVIPGLPTLYDEPFADSSQIPTALVSRLARRSVTVSLSGDGGDELFAGYGRYRKLRRLRRIMGLFPRASRRAAAAALTAVPDGAWSGLDRVLRSTGLPRPRRPIDSGRARRVAQLLSRSGSPYDLYLQIIRSGGPGSVVEGGVEARTRFDDRSAWQDSADMVRSAMVLDFQTYLPDDIMVKVDRASMGVGLEARAPLLDHRVIEFAWSLPMSLNLRDGRGKWLLRQVLDRYVPRHLVHRPKMGFGVPIAAWLRGPLRDWAEALLDEGRLRDEGYFQAETVRRRWSEHLRGGFDWHPFLWSVLMFQAWLESLASDPDRRSSSPVHEVARSGQR